MEIFFSIYTNISIWDVSVLITQLVRLKKHFKKSSKKYLKRTWTKRGYLIWNVSGEIKVLMKANVKRNVAFGVWMGEKYVNRIWQRVVVREHFNRFETLEKSHANQINRTNALSYLLHTCSLSAFTIDDKSSVHLNSTSKANCFRTKLRFLYLFPLTIFAVKFRWWIQGARCEAGRKLSPHDALNELYEASNVGVDSIGVCKSAKLSKRRDSDNVVHAIGLRHHNLRKKIFSQREWDRKETKKSSSVFSLFRYNFVQNMRKWKFFVTTFSSLCVQRECNNLVVCSRVMFVLPSFVHSFVRSFARLKAKIHRNVFHVIASCTNQPEVVLLVDGDDDVKSAIRKKDNANLPSAISILTAISLQHHTESWEMLKCIVVN